MPAKATTLRQAIHAVYALRTKLIGKIAELQAELALAEYDLGTCSDAGTRHPEAAAIPEER